MPNYLLAAAPVPGHVAPMTQIGKDLVRRGHRVRMLSGEEFTETIRAAGIDPVALAPECHIAPPAAKAHRARVTGPVDRWRRGRTELRELFVEPMAAQHRSLHRALRTGPVDAVLVDVAFTGVLPTLLAGAPRPPVLACGVVPLMLSSVDTPPFGMGRPPTRRRDYPAMGWVVHRLLFGPTQALADRQLRALGRPRLPVFLIDWPKPADRLLQLTVPSFEYPRRDLPPTVTFAGPVLPEPPPKTALPASWPELAGSRPVIHVAQGTWDNTDLDRLIGPALRALATEDALVVATTGGPPAGELPAPLPANTRVAEFLPYQWLLPQVDVMVTNGGYGGVQCALAHGVPLVVAGGTADKPEVAARVAYTGAGIDLRTGTPTEHALATAVRTVLHTSTYRQQARRLARDIAASRPLDTIANALTVCGGQTDQGRFRSTPPNSSTTCRYRPETR